VPPIRDRKQAVLRWAHKILGQEGVVRDRDMKGFTPDAEQAMLLYDWPGNISEMRQCIHNALEKTDKDWLTPVDLGLFKGINPDGAPYLPEPMPFLATCKRTIVKTTPSSSAGGMMLLGERYTGVGIEYHQTPWGLMEDELVLATLDRYRGDLRQTGNFCIKPQYQPLATENWCGRKRNGSALWQKPVACYANGSGVPQSVTLHCCCWRINCWLT
jgi:DNA-binding NtrC family response regulator